MPDQNESLGVDSRATVERVVKEQQPLVRTEDCEMAQVIEKTGAGEGNRTLVISLEGCCSTIELHPQKSSSGTLPSPTAFVQRGLQRSRLRQAAFAVGWLASRRATYAKGWWER